MKQGGSSRAISGARDHVVTLNKQAMGWSPYKALDMVPSGAGNVAAWCSFRRKREGVRGGLAEALQAFDECARWRK